MRRLPPATGNSSTAHKLLGLHCCIRGLVGVIVFSALDHRFGWSPVPGWVSVLGALLVAIGLFIDLLVMRENTFGASNIRVEEGQTVTTSGPYAIARHPMY